MENTQLEEKVLELASSIKKIGEISNDDYFYRTILFPGELVSALESEGEKDFSEDSMISFRNNAQELLPLQYSVKKELRRLEAEFEE